MKNYYALVHKDTDSAFGISFPDLPGCFGAADDEADLHEAAQSALVLYAQGASDLPDARTMREILADRNIKAELASGAVLIAVPLIVVERKSRFNVMLDADVVAGIDRTARIMGVTRSEFLSVAGRDRLKSVAGAAIVTAHKAASAASEMAQTKTKDVTSKGVASKAGKILHDPKASKEAKSAAASALSQTPGKKAAAKKK